MSIKITKKNFRRPRAGQKKNGRVDWRHAQEVLNLARMGFSAYLIQKKTGLTVGQIYYRLGAKHVTISGYRNGETADARKILNLLVKNVAKKVS